MTGGQKHLTHKSQVDLGSFYTPQNLVQKTFELITKNIDRAEEYVLVDTSCGYGSFLLNNLFPEKIGADVDPLAVEQAKKEIKDARFFVKNSLKDVSRKQFELSDDKKLIIIGNPPYNDTTSIIRQNIKSKDIGDNIDSDIKTRDLGMSFMLSYNKLKADFVCILHPLSYLIKKANFALLRNFAKNYVLVDSVIVSSHEFSDTSKTMAFPILIALYRRDERGMNYDYIKGYKFDVKGGGSFRLNDFDTIANYVQKYPNKKYLADMDKPVARFWTLRDINALRRNRTFIKEDTYNTVYVPVEKLPYYCYIDVFKQYIDRMPYYIGNCDVIIDNEEFLKIKECFVYQSVKTNPILKNMKFREIPDAKFKIDSYFNKLLINKIGGANATNTN